MIVDSSAVVAIVTKEECAIDLLHALRMATRVFMSAATYVELGVVLDRRLTPEERHRVDAMLTSCDVEIVPNTSSQAKIARAAYRDFGKGSGHAAHLNMGDCFSYALASETGEELLFAGESFTHTDVMPAWHPSTLRDDTDPL